jgi:hypothetical protein
MNPAVSSFAVAPNFNQTLKQEYDDYTNAISVIKKIFNAQSPIKRKARFNSKTTEALLYLAKKNKNPPKWSVNSRLLSQENQVSKKETIVDANSKALSVIRDIKPSDLTFITHQNSRYFSFNDDVKGQNPSGLFTIYESEVFQGKPESLLHKVLANELTPLIIEGRTYYLLESTPVKKDQPVLESIPEEPFVNSYSSTLRNELHSILKNFLDNNIEKEQQIDTSQSTSTQNNLNEQEIKKAISMTGKRFEDLALFNNSIQDSVLKGPLINVVKSYLLQQEKEIEKMKANVDQDVYLRLEKQAQKKANLQHFDRKPAHINLSFIKQIIDQHVTQFTDEKTKLITIYECLLKEEKVNMDEADKQSRMNQLLAVISKNDTSQDL